MPNTEARLDPDASPWGAGWQLLEEESARWRRRGWASDGEDSLLLSAALRTERAWHMLGAVRSPVWLEWSQQGGEIREGYRGGSPGTLLVVCTVSRLDPEGIGSHRKVLSQEGVSSHSYNDVV